MIDEEYQKNILNIFLSQSAENSNIKNAKAALEKGADVNFVNSSSGLGAIHIAAKNGDLDLLNALLSHGVDEQKESKFGQTAKDMGILFGQHDFVAAIDAVVMSKFLNQSILPDTSGDVTDFIF